jgi:Holliday junction resolvase
MVDSRDKGSRAEAAIKKTMKELTGLPWERTPSSGALDPKHGLKGDLYVPNRTNLFCVECKHYADDHINSGILTHKTPQLFSWWEQCKRQADQVSREPLLIFKFDRSKLFCAFEVMPESHTPFVYISRDGNEFYVAMLEDWIKLENPKFVS